MKIRVACCPLLHLYHGCMVKRWLMRLCFACAEDIASSIDTRVHIYKQPVNFMCMGPCPQKRVERRSTAMVVRRLFKSFPARVEELWAEARCLLSCICYL